jgi:LPS-assembly protein
MVRGLFLILSLLVALIAEGHEVNTTQGNGVENNESNESSVPVKRLEIKASSIKSEGKVVKASQDALVHYDRSLLTADDTRYDTQQKKLYLKGDVQSIGYMGLKEHASEVEVDTQTDEARSKNLFLVNDNDIWLYAKEGHKRQGVYALGRSTLSSCDVESPLWRMEVSDADYYSDEQYVELFYATFYMQGIPLFYLPYWYVSTNKERRSGLLTPIVGSSSTDGTFYEQPIFWAISKSMDLEITPQIRTKRSVGAQGTFRWVDSPHSRMFLNVGYFKDKESYNPQKDAHYGLDFGYGSPNFWEGRPSDYNDSLYVNLSYLNDIEYIHLQHSDMNSFLYVHPIRQSKVNYALYSDDYYYGVNAKYFIDTRKETNDATLQILPSLQWHKYLEPLFIDNLTYSIDAKIDHFYRKEGTTLKQAQFNIPLEYSTSFLNDYAHFSLREKFYYNKYFFGNGEFTEEEFEYYNSIHDVSIYSDLVKAYGNYTHVLQPYIEYEHPGFERKGATSAYEALLEDQQDLFSIGLPERNFKLGLKQYVYEKKKLRFSHRVAEVYYPEGELQWSDIENELRYYWRKWSFYNRTLYSFDFDKLRESSSTMSLRQRDYSIRVTHSYIDYLEDVTRNDVDALGLSASYKLNSQINFSAGLWHDLELEQNRQLRFNAGYHRDCWGVNISWVKNTLPTVSNTAEERKYFYFQIHFKPFGSIGK